MILAVTPANQDIATSEAIKMAKEVDRFGMKMNIINEFQKCEYLMIPYPNIPSPISQAIGKKPYNPRI